MEEFTLLGMYNDSKSGRLFKLTKLESPILFLARRTNSLEEQKETRY